MRRTERAAYAEDTWKYIHYRLRGCKKYIGFPIMARAEWDKFLIESGDELEKLRRKWIESGREARLLPTVDRIDPKKGYVVGNCRWLPQWVNSALGRRNSDSCKRGHPWVAENIYQRPNGERECRSCIKLAKARFCAARDLALSGVSA